MLYGNQQHPPVIGYGDYHQGWSSIVEEFVKRLENMAHAPKVKKYVKFVEGNAMTDEWREEFAQEVSFDGEQQTIVNLMMFNRLGYPVTKVSEDDSMWFTRVSDVELYVFYSWQNFEIWEKIMEDLQAVLHIEDRTLGMRCLTFSLPEGGESTLSDFAGVNCHSTKITFKIKEAGMRKK